MTDGRVELAGHRSDDLMVVLEDLGLGPEDEPERPRKVRDVQRLVILVQDKDHPVHGARMLCQIADRVEDARAIASQQLVRLELAMVDRRRWNTGEFRACFLEHPLMRHLAARLVWGLYEDGQLASCFRVAEDFSLADASDRAFELPADAAVGIPHVLEMDAATQATFGQLFGDYEILQPFRQLGRETYAFGPQELEQVEITRFARTATSGGVLGLVNRGWRKGEAESGCVSWLHRLLPDGLEAMLQLDPGLRVGEFDAAETQHLPSLVLRQAGAGWYGEAVPFGRLTTMAVSELLRDIDLLAPAQD